MPGGADGSQISVPPAARQIRMVAAHATCDDGRALQEVPHVDKVTSNGATSRLPGDYDPNVVHRPSETTSTQPSTTLTAVCSSMA